MEDRTYIAIDLKSFYASVECNERGKDPLDYLLVVADKERTDKTICLAVSAPLKSFSVPSRARLFEAKEIVRKENIKRSKKSWLKGSSKSKKELDSDKSLRIDFEIACPRMGLYIAYSRKIYSIYLRYIDPNDIHVYSIDEVFIDATDYLRLYKTDAKSFSTFLIKQILKETGITATAGIGPNLYLAKVAMDIEAKHIKADQDGVRVAILDEKDYRKKLWNHTPLTDFWRIGRGIERRLRDIGLYTMRDIAICSISEKDDKNEDLLYKTFGKNAELLIDHAWGLESCTLKDIKNYRPKANSLSSGQVLECPYEAKEALLVLLEMADSLALELIEKGQKCDHLSLYIGYDISNLKDKNRTKAIKATMIDHYNREIPLYSHASVPLKTASCSSAEIRASFAYLFKTSVNTDLLIKRLNIAASIKEEQGSQMDLFTDREKKTVDAYEKEKMLLSSVLKIKNRYGKNSLLRGISFLDGATAIKRNMQIGGHRA